MQGFHLLRLIMIVLAASFQVHLPTVASNGHLHNLRRPFVNRGDANVALDFFNHVLFCVAVAAKGLNTGIRRQIACFSSEIFGNRTFGIEIAIFSFAIIDTLCRFFDKRARSFEADSMRHNQLVCIALFLGKRAASWMRSIE